MCKHVKVVQNVQNRAKLCKMYKIVEKRKLLNPNYIKQILQEVPSVAEKVLPVVVTTSAMLFPPFDRKIEN